MARVGQWFSVDSRVRGGVFQCLWLKFTNKALEGSRKPAVGNPGGRMLQAEGRADAKTCWGGGACVLGWRQGWRKRSEAKLAMDVGRGTWQTGLGLWPHMKQRMSRGLSCSVGIVWCVGKSQGRCWAYLGGLYMAVIQAEGFGGLHQPRAVFEVWTVLKRYLAWLGSGHGVYVVCRSLFQQYFVSVLYSYFLTIAWFSDIPTS